MTERAAERATDLTAERAAELKAELKAERAAGGPPREEAPAGRPASRSTVAEHERLLRRWDAVCREAAALGLAFDPLPDGAAT